VAISEIIAAETNKEIAESACGMDPLADFFWAPPYAA
jgi:hypothetical protein